MLLISVVNGRDRIAMPGFIAMRREGHAGASKSCPSWSAGDARMQRMTATARKEAPGCIIGSACGQDGNPGSHRKQHFFSRDVVLRRILVWTGVVLAGCAPGAGQQFETGASPPTKSAGQSSLTNRALLNRYCVIQGTIFAGLPSQGDRLGHVRRPTATVR